MTRRLLGYVVKLPDGTRFSGTPKPCSRDEAESFGDDIEGWVVPVFSKPRSAEPKPAPVVAAEGRYACLVRRHGFEFFYAETVELENQLHKKAVAEDVARRQRGWADAARVVRVFEDGAHESALAAAREEGRREERLRTLADVRKALLARQSGYALAGQMAEADACQYATCDLDQMTEVAK